MNLLRALFVFVLLTAFSLPASASPVYTGDGNLAIKGYDSVAYFTSQSALKGKANFQHSWNGAVWQFSSAENLELFKSNPEKYAPQYGGFCAWGVAAKKDLFPIDPQAWRVVDNKLYLNYDKKVQSNWLKDTSGFIEAANKYWPEVSSKKN